MESLVYENSPLADYLQGEGQANADWIIPESEGEEGAQSPAEPIPNFAPRGTSKFRDRIRSKLPKPLDLGPSQRSVTLDQLCETITSIVNSRIGRSDNEKFLEQFGYLIVASQLLNEHSAPSYTSAADVLSNSRTPDLPPFPAAAGIQGIVITAVTSFSIVWLFSWCRSRSGSGLDLRRVGLCLVLVPILGILFYAFARRQWLKYLRHQALDAAATFISNAQRFDSAASASVVFIQEVELVSRGYRISTPLPPVTRLEDQTQTRRCLRLRRTVSEALLSTLERYIKAQRTLRPLTDTANLEKYYDIYEISTEELIAAESGLAERTTEDQYSLRSLRILFGRLYSVRKSVLCCLLALGVDGGGSDIARWSTALEEMRDLATVTGSSMRRMTGILDEEDRDVILPSSLPVASPKKERVRAQYRRLTALSQGIRALHAKMHVIREESNPAIEPDGATIDIESTLLAQYESIGADIRSLLQEWEAGKSALINSLEKPSVADRLSHSSTGLKLPLSPTPSLGGTTAVEGSPADALKALNGESRPSSSIIDDEEIFEAVAFPTRNKRASLTREERIARVKEDRARQVAARERADANTHMLKELEMVIQQRPRASKRVTSL